MRTRAKRDGNEAAIVEALAGAAMTLRGEAGCLAEEWHRDGRGIWAVRRCSQLAGADHGPRHLFTSWSFGASQPVPSERRTEQPEEHPDFFWHRIGR